ncbi:hypothetical protein ACT7C7_29835 [Bacillus cereus]
MNNQTARLSLWSHPIPKHIGPTFVSCKVASTTKFPLESVSSVYMNYFGNSPTEIVVEPNHHIIFNQIGETTPHITVNSACTTFTLQDVGQYLIFASILIKGENMGLLTYILNEIPQTRSSVPVIPQNGVATNIIMDRFDVSSGTVLSLNNSSEHPMTLLHGSIGNMPLNYGSISIIKIQ